jgi:quinol monooxygenase YgiN
MTRIHNLMVVTAFCASALLPFAATASEQVIVVVRTFAAEGRDSELLARSLKQIEFLRKAEPTATFRLFRSAKAPTTFLWYEVYESQAAYDSHLNVVMPSFRKEAGPPPQGLMAKPPESELYVELAK